ncbi:MAG: hypothetical protein RBT47_03430 [Anaerolineae bacterium]|nr:hypothetical protein [Anaerolineae bacterium]
MKAAVWVFAYIAVLGSVRQWTNSAGAVVGSAAYDPFGGPLADSSSPAVLSTGGSWGYAGEWTDPSGLQYLRARWYLSRRLAYRLRAGNPAIGRFTQVNPATGMLQPTADE